MGKYLDWIKENNIGVKLGKTGLAFAQGTSQEIKDKVNKKRSHVIAELLYEENDTHSPLIEALRKQRRAATSVMASEFDLEVAKVKVHVEGKALFSGEYGEFWIVKDNSVTIDDKRPCFNLAELYLIRNCTEEQLKQLFEIKVKMGGEILPDNTDFFKEG